MRPCIKARSIGGIAGRVLYWPEDDEDLSEHVGRLVEIDGELEDFEIGEVKIEQDGDFTEIELDLEGKKEKARVPTSWLRGIRAERDQKFEIAARRIDVDARAIRHVGPLGTGRTPPACVRFRTVDLLIFNEVDPGVAGSTCRDVARELAAMFGMNYAYSVEFTQGESLRVTESAMPH